MLKQLLISVVVIVAAAAAYVFFVPGAAQTLEGLGITLPAIAASTPDATTPAAAGGAAGAQAGNRPAGGAAGGRGGGRGNRTMIVLTAPVQTATINDSLTAIGEGTAAQSVTVMAPASGTLEQLLVQPGQSIEAGAVIGRLDADAEQIAYERAVVAQQDADASLSRTQELAKANSATTVQINAAQLAATNAELATKTAKLALDRRTITSPIAGTVGLFQVSAGNQVSAQSVVTTIEDTSEIVISFWVPERYSGLIDPGMSVETSAVALPGRTIPGTVRAIDNRIDPASRTLKVQAEVANIDNRLRPGMSFSVALSFPGEEFPSVDPLAIQWSSDGAYLWRYADGKVTRVNVDIIQRNSDGVLVQGELTQADQVVTEGVQQLSEGATVTLLDGAVAEAGGGATRPRAAPATDDAAPAEATSDETARPAAEGGTRRPGSGNGNRRPGGGQDENSQGNGSGGSTQQGGDAQPAQP